MLLCILYHVVPELLHHLVYKWWGKAIVRHECRNPMCNRVWYALKNPAYYFDHNCNCVPIYAPRMTCAALRRPLAVLCTRTETGYMPGDEVQVSFNKESDQ